METKRKTYRSCHISPADHTRLKDEVRKLEKKTNFKGGVQALLHEAIECYFTVNKALK